MGALEQLKAELAEKEETLEVLQAKHAGVLDEARRARTAINGVCLDIDRLGRSIRILEGHE